LLVTGTQGTEVLSILWGKEKKRRKGKNRERCVPCVPPVPVAEHLQKRNQAMTVKEQKRLFEWICRIDPRVLTLYEEINSLKDDGRSYFCANELWYWGGDPHSKTRKQSFKESMEELVGWGRKAANKEDSIEGYLGSSDAYDIVYQTLYAALPDCRDCSCIATDRMIYAELYRRRLKR
jgi:hypothetical protein